MSDSKINLRKSPRIPCNFYYVVAFALFGRRFWGVWELRVLSSCFSVSIDKPKEAKKDTFLEKLATQVIKNVQVKITDIHIKYEDDVSDFSILSWLLNVLWYSVFYDILSADYLNFNLQIATPVNMPVFDLF